LCNTHCRTMSSPTSSTEEGSAPGEALLSGGRQVVKNRCAQTSQSCHRPGVLAAEQKQHLLQQGQKQQQRNCMLLKVSHAASEARPMVHQVHQAVCKIARFITASHLSTRANAMSMRLKCGRWTAVQLWSDCSPSSTCRIRICFSMSNFAFDHHLWVGLPGTLRPTKNGFISGGPWSSAQSAAAAMVAFSSCSAAPCRSKCGLG
jgi:hypothetical protein